MTRTNTQSRAGESNKQDRWTSSTVWLQWANSNTAGPQWVGWTVLQSDLSELNSNIVGRQWAERYYSCSNTGKYVIFCRFSKTKIGMLQSWEVLESNDQVISLETDPWTGSGRHHEQGNLSICLHCTNSHTTIHKPQQHLELQLFLWPIYLQVKFAKWHITTKQSSVLL